jgi:protein-disulfide isomerase
MPGLRRDYIDTGKVKFVFKSLPIDNLHPNAFRKTEASLCVREMGGDSAFFNYYDQLFTLFGFSLNLDDTLVNLAQAQNLDPVKFRACLTSGKYKKRINDEVVEAVLINSMGTPTWLIGNTLRDGLQDAVKLNGLIDYDSFKTIIEKKLEQ